MTAHEGTGTGEFAGSLAHDFNNLLAAILNYAGFVAEEITNELGARPADERVRLTAVLSDVAQIVAAAEQAARLLANVRSALDA